MAKINLPRQDHYDVARDKALAELKEHYDTERLSLLGADVTAEGTLELSSLGWRLGVSLEPFSMVLRPGGEPCSIVWQILVLNYLCAAPPRTPERFLSFADFKEGRTYLKVFDARVTKRLSRKVGRDAGEFRRAAQRNAGTLGGKRPLNYVFRFFPRFELQVVWHEGDEDFPPSCNVLFPENALEILTTEVIIVAAERLVSSLEGKRPCD